MARARARGRILVVDDEVPVRKVIRTILEDEGFEVCAHGDAESVLSEPPGELCAAVVDLHLPGRNGLELARALRASRPALPVLLVSGFLAEVEDLRPFPYLAKPFGPDALLAALDAILA